MIEQRYEVLATVADPFVADPFENRLYPKLIEVILKRRDIHILGVNSEPGMAKTTLLGQLVDAIRTVEKVPIFPPKDNPSAPSLWVTFLPFGWYMRRTENRFKEEGRPKWNRRDWGDEELDEFSDGYYELARDMGDKAAQFEDEFGLRSILLMDNVAKGKLNRGKTTLKRLARRRDFFGLGLEADPRIQYRAEKVRRLVKLAEGDLQKIRQAFMENNVYPDIIDDPEQLRLVTMRTGSPRTIEVIRKEVGSMALDWAREELDDLSKIDQIIKYLPPNANSLSTPERFWFQLKIAYMYHFLSAEMGLPLNRMAVGLVEYLELAPIHLYQRPLERMTE